MTERYSLELGDSLARALRGGAQPLESVLPAILQAFNLCLQSKPSKTRCVAAAVARRVLADHCAGGDGGLRHKVEDLFRGDGRDPAVAAMAAIDFLSYWQALEG